MGVFFKMLKEDKTMQFIYMVMAILIMAGIGCVVFAITHPPV